VLELVRAFAHGLRQRAQVIQDEAAGLRHEEAQRGVHHVRRGQAVVQPAALGPDALRDVGHERDDVVLHLALDLLDAGHVEARPRADGLHRFARHDPPLGQHLARGQLDAQPGRELVLLGPEAGHFGAGVSGNHRKASSLRV